MRSGGTPNFCSTPAASSVSLVMVLTSVTCGVDQLRDVLVAGGNDHAHAGALGLRAPACRSRRRPRRRRSSAAASPSRAIASCSGSICARKIVRHRRPVGLVLGIEVVAEGLALGVEHAGAIIGRVVLVQPAQHVEHAVDRAGRLAAPGCAGRAWRETRGTGRTSRRPAAVFSCQDRRAWNAGARP